MAIKLERAYATVPLGRNIVKVIEEPSMKESLFNGKPDYVAHFFARGKSGELIECTALHNRALEAFQKIKAGDDVIVDVTVKIYPLGEILEYKHTAYFIC